jgi:hypothetical protein
VSTYRAKLALLLDGTSEGAIKGWETRRHGGGAPQTREELAAESAPGGRFETLEKRKAEQQKAELRIRASVKETQTFGATVTIAHATPQLIRAAEATAAVMEDMKAQGLTMPDQVTIEHATVTGQKGPSGQVRHVSITEGDVERRSNHLVIRVPDTLPDDIPLDDATAIVFSEQSKKFLPKDFDDDTRATYDRFTARTMRDVIVHEMAHVQDVKKTVRGVIPGSTARIKTGPMADWGKLTPKAKAIQRAALRVSVYAVKNRNEFVAEAFTRMHRGETLADDSMALYKKLKGPRVLPS